MGRYTLRVLYIPLVQVGVAHPRKLLPHGGPPGLVYTSLLRVPFRPLSLCSPRCSSLRHTFFPFVLPSVHPSFSNFLTSSISPREIKVKASAAIYLLLCLFISNTITRIAGTFFQRFSNAFVANDLRGTFFEL